MVRLILIRHGKTAKNVRGILHSRSDDSSLDEEGIDQMKRVGRVLKGENVVQLFCSKEKRAVESARIISQICRVTRKEVAGLEERDWGVFEGCPWSDVQAILERLSLDERYTYTPEGGESWQAFEGRIIGALGIILEGAKGGVVAVITHGGVIRALLPYLLGVPKEESFKFDPANASLTIFNFDKGKFTKVVVDDRSHLDQRSGGVL